VAIDLHTHILCGIDDGAADEEESIAIARALVAAGTEIAAATPHMREDFPNDLLQIEAGLDRLGRRLRADGVPLQLVMGAEVALTWLDEVPSEDLDQLSLGGSGYILIESPYSAWPLDTADRLFRLRVRGLTPVLAHPERNSWIQQDATPLESWVDAGALVQVTASSLRGLHGRAVRRTAARMVEQGLAHIIASDAHAPTGRVIDLASAASGDRRLATWLTWEVPAAMLAGEPIPPRPARRAWFRRR
jgi:protein-tyrosine phosphatase